MNASAAASLVSRVRLIQLTEKGILLSSSTASCRRPAVPGTERNQLLARELWRRTGVERREGLGHSGPMRELLEEMASHQPLDPTEAARRAMRPRLRRRFYRDVQVADGAEGYWISLDGRAVCTPARRPLAAPSRTLADLIAAEWEAQRDGIDPATMPLTRLANTVIDGVTANRTEVAAEVEKYLGSDLVLYRAEAPDGLVARQASAWDPVLAFARDVLRAPFVASVGVAFVAQPREAIAAAAVAIPRGSGREAWRLAALHSITTLTGSGLIALAIAGRALSVDAAWAAAHVDEDWNMDSWGRDPIAMERRAYRFSEMKAAAQVLEIV